MKNPESLLPQAPTLSPHPERNRSIGSVPGLLTCSCPALFLASGLQAFSWKWNLQTTAKNFMAEERKDNAHRPEVAFLLQSLEIGLCLSVQVHRVV